MTTLYAQASAAWASANWNTQADGGGSAQSPVDGDTCEANGQTVTIGTNLPIGVTLKCTAGGQFGLSALDLTTYCLKSAVVAPEFVISGHDNYTGGSAGTYHPCQVAEVLDSVSFGAASAETGTYHAPDAAEVLDSAVFGPASGTPGTYHEATAAEVKDGTGFGAGSALTGTYSPGGTYVEGEAAQLAADQAAVLAKAAYIDDTQTIIGQAGTLDMDLYVLRSELAPLATIQSQLDARGITTSNKAQTGDAFARLGAPAGASIAADIAAVKATTATGGGEAFDG